MATSLATCAVAQLSPESSALSSEQLFCFLPFAANEDNAEKGLSRLNTMQRFIKGKGKPPFSTKEVDAASTGVSKLGGIGDIEGKLRGVEISSADIC
jgi:hypothetical protein